MSESIKSESIKIDKWQVGKAPVAVIMISLNEAHNMEAVLQNLQGFAQEVFLVDSYSADDTVSIALSKNVHVVQRRFRDFGDQWNFALEQLPISAQWTMKLDPDERLSDKLKASIIEVLQRTDAQGLSFERRLWFMGKVLPVKHALLRVWRTGKCRFTDISVNEHPIVTGKIQRVNGILEHHDSPDLDHWLEKQNRYTTAEAIMAFEHSPMADKPIFFGSTFQRRMWMKKNFSHLPFRFTAFFLYNYLILGAWRAGWQGIAWARMRTEVMRLRDYKLKEMKLMKRYPIKRTYGIGSPDSRVQQCE